MLIFFAPLREFTVSSKRAIDLQVKTSSITVKGALYTIDHKVIVGKYMRKIHNYKKVDIKKQYRQQKIKIVSSSNLIYFKTTQRVKEEHVFAYNFTYD